MKPQPTLTRRELLAAEANKQLAGLLGTEADRWLSNAAPVLSAPAVIGGFASEEEENELAELNEWVQNRGLAEGLLGFELVDDASGEQRAVLDIAWPNGVRQELTEAVALLIDESAELMSLANSAGFRCFTTTHAFRQYVIHEVEGEPVS